MRILILTAVLLAWVGTASADSLHELAASPEKIAEIRQALEEGADPGARDEKGWTPMAIAAAAGHTEIVDLFLKAGADVEGRAYAGRTPLIAIAANHEWNLEPGRPERLVATAKLLIRHGASVKAFDHRGWPALILAAANGHIELVELLLEHGAEIDLARTDGYNALHHAAARGKTSTVKFLLDAGADPNLITKDGQNALQLAMRYEWFDTADLIRSYSAP